MTSDDGFVSLQMRTSPTSKDFVIMEEVEISDGGVFQQPIDRDALTRFCTLLKNKADKVLNGEALFSLTTEVLSRLCHDCRRHSLKQNEEDSRQDESGAWQSKSFELRNKEKESIELEWKYNIQFIKDFILSSPSVKITHSYGTISYPINIHRFGNLSSLELRKVPIHLVEGLQALRGHLKSLVANRCFSKPKELLETCGGDRSAPLSWQHLKYISLVFNEIHQLDDSLRLLPYVESVDFSHNQIESCDSNLEYLNDVLSINLAYNILIRVPIFSVNTRTCLTSLTLRGNNLDNIQGLEEATALQNLDLGENFMVKHAVLFPLKSLPCLKQLYLDGNPLFYHKQHRTNTVSYLPYRVVTIQFLLDGKKLSRGEIASYRPPKPEEQRTLGSGHPAQPPGNMSINADLSSMTSSGVDTRPHSSSTPRKKNRRKKLKARDTEIRDTSFDYSSGQDYTPAASPSTKFLDEQMEARRQEALQTKREIELLKEQYGSDYLQAIEDRKLFSQAPSETASDSDGGRLASKLKKHKRNLSGFKKTSLETSVEVSSDVTENALEVSENVVTELDPSNGASEGKKDGESAESIQNLHTSDDNVTEADNSLKSDHESGDSVSKVEKESSSVTSSVPSNPIMAAIERIASGQSSDESGAERKAMQGVVDFGALSSETNQLPQGDVLVDKVQNVENVKKKRLVKQDSVIDKDEVFSSVNEDFSTPSKLTVKEELNVNRVLPQASVSPIKIVSKLSQSLSMQEESSSEACLSPLSPESNVDTSQSSSAILSPNRSTSEVDISTDNSFQLSEDEQESEPVFVTLPEEKDKMVIVTFTDVFLVEKDVRGKVIEKLDMRSLISVDVKKLRRKSSSDEIGEDVGWKPHSTCATLDSDTKTKEMALRLKFDYIRKDRQKRCYLVDVHDGKKVLSHLQPVLDSKAEKERAKDLVMMQCLKCNKTFNKKELTQKSQQLPRSGSSKDFQSMKAMTDNPTLICPACSSPIIIEIVQDSGKSVETSNPSTPTGSYHSSGSFLESSQKPQKPAPLIHNKSFDSQSLQAKLASKLTARKSSVTSIDFEKSPRKTGSGSSSVKSLVSTGSSPQVHQEIKTGLFETRERSNAFKAASPGLSSSSSQMTQSASLAPKEQTLLESEELICVEDHFIDEKTDFTSTEQLALMTSSLRGDASTKEKHASLIYKPFNQHSLEHMEDSGFESGVYLSGSANLTPQDVRGRQKGDIESDVGKVSRSDGLDRSNEISMRDTPDSKRNYISESHKHLVSMEHRVNSLVQEGESMENEKWRMSNSEYRQHHRNSISVSDLKKMISTTASSRKESIDVDPDGEAASTTLRNSGSGSSIAILPTNENPDVSSHASAAQVGSLESAPVQFVIGSVDKSLDRSAMERSSSDLIRVSSPLNSNICSSMVSSVYETSVASGEKESACTSEIQPVALGSSESAKSNASVEDLSSIYDQPANLHSGSVKSKKKRKRHKKKSPQDTQTSETDPSAGESRNSPTAYTDLVDRISADSHLRTQKVSSSSTEELEAGAHSVARSFSTNGDPDNGESHESEVDEDMLETEATYRFDHLNHRLTLYLMMSVFSEDEEFKCKSQAEITQYSVPETYPGILIMTTQRFYILKITSEDQSKEPEEWLSPVEVQPIPELRYLDVGLGGQSLRIEFVTDCSSYTLVTKDKDKTMQFVEILHNNLAHYAVSQGITSKVVVNEDVDQMTLDNLDVDVVSKGKSEQKLLLYCMGFIERGNQKLYPVCFVVSTNAICLVRTNHQWPQPRLQGPITVESVGKQFTVLERQMINNVASAEICEVSLRKIKLELFNETEGISTEWNITMTNRQNAINFIHAISEPWAKEFGVEMEIMYSELEF